VPIDFEKIRESHASIVWSVAWRILRNHADALECSQEVFLEAYQKSLTTSVENWGGFLNWLTARRAIDILRKRVRQPVSQGAELADFAKKCPPDSAAVLAELTELIRNELRALPSNQAEAFWLTSVEEMSYSEVASQLNIEVNAVGVLVHRARKHLKAALRELNPDQSHETLSDVSGKQ
jgi:RNA polymerase sigma-70 factor (ECF subfamily)